MVCVFKLLNANSQHNESINIQLFHLKLWLEAWCLSLSFDMTTTSFQFFFVKYSQMIHTNAHSLTGCFKHFMIEMRAASIMMIIIIVIYRFINDTDQFYVLSESFYTYYEYLSRLVFEVWQQQQCYTNNSKYRMVRK